MKIDEASKVLIIDDEVKDASNVQKFLKRALTRLEKSSPSINVEFVIQVPDNKKDFSEYIALINSMPASAVLIDHRLGVKSNVEYTGLTLANAIRSAKPDFPIFILTKYAKDDNLEKQGFDVDDVMDKMSLVENPQTYLGRILRSIGRYQDAKTERSKRMQELIALSLYRKLSAEETHELVNIRAEIGLSTLGREIEMAELERVNLQQKKDVLDALRKLVDEA